MPNSWILHFQFRGMTFRLLHDQSANDLAMQAFESYKVVPARAKETGLSRKELMKSPQSDTRWIGAPATGSFDCGVEFNLLRISEYYRDVLGLFSITKNSSVKGGRD